MRPACRAEQIADAYLDWMLRQAEVSGAVLVAESGGSFVGFVAGWIEQADNVAETPDFNRFGYISDICVSRRLFVGSGSPSSYWTALSTISAATALYGCASIRSR